MVPSGVYCLLIEIGYIRCTLIHGEDAGIYVRYIKANSVIDTPPWTLNIPEVNFSLTADKKDNTDAFIFKNKFQELTSHYPDFKYIYTDGSKDGPKVAAACVSRTQTRKCRLLDTACIFSA